MGELNSSPLNNVATIAIALAIRTYTISSTFFGTAIALTYAQTLQLLQKLNEQVLD